MRLKLGILPFRGTSKSDLATLAGDLQFLGFLDIVCLEEAKVPEGALDPQRHQYCAEPFLDRVRRENYERVLGVTDLDLYSGSLNFVFGLAELPGKAAVISLNRLHFGASDSTFRGRALKEATHELGHTFGLQHCTNSQCVMSFSNSLADTDRKGETYCKLCVRKLRAALALRL